MSLRGDEGCDSISVGLQHPADLSQSPALKSILASATAMWER